jgi:hypothetical protein
VGRVKNSIRFGCALWVGAFLDADRITASDFALLQHPRKNAFPRHDAITGLIINGAAVVALFADLGNFNQSVFSQSNPGAHRNVFPVNAGAGDVFSRPCSFFKKASSTVTFCVPFFLLVAMDMIFIFFLK